MRGAGPFGAEPTETRGSGRSCARFRALSGKKGRTTGSRGTHCEAYGKAPARYADESYEAATRRTYSGAASGTTYFN